MEHVVIPLGLQERILWCLDSTTHVIFPPYQALLDAGIASIVAEQQEFTTTGTKVPIDELRVEVSFDLASDLIAILQAQSLGARSVLDHMRVMEALVPLKGLTTLALMLDEEPEL